MRIAMHRVRALSFAPLALAHAGRAAGFAAADWRWGLADVALATILLAIGAGLWAGWRWLRFLGLGLVGHGLVKWGILGVRLASYGDLPPPGETWAMTCGVFAVACAAPVVSCWTWPGRAGLRHAVALVLAGAALDGAIAFAATPGLPPLVAGAVLLGSGGIVAGSIGVGLGRTWGLLLILSSALLLIVGIVSAPTVAALSGSHPWFPGGVYIAIRVTGVITAVLGASTAALYVGPIVAFLRRVDPR